MQYLVPALDNAIGGLTGYIVVSDNTPDEGDTLTLTFVETSITGEFTASDNTPDEGDELTLEFVPVAYTYQWKKDGSNLSDGGDVSGATTEELTITNVDPDDDGDYTVAVTNPVSGRVRTFGPENIAVISGRPIITAANQSVEYGQAFTYQPTATNSPTSWSVTGLPVGTGLILDTTTGELYGVPTASDIAASPFEISLVATNGFGAGPTKVIEITVTAQYYIDQVAGDDGDDGSLSTPFKTLAAAAAVITDHEAIALKAGSVFRQEVYDPAAYHNNVTFCKYGAGADPISNAGQVIDQSTATQPDAGGKPNVWQIDVSGFAGIPDFAALLIDDVSQLYVKVTGTGHAEDRAVSVADQATAIQYVEDNAGYFYVAYNAGDLEFYFHSTTNPTADGKVYEIGSGVVGFENAVDPQSTFSLNDITVKNYSTRQGFFNNLPRLDVFRRMQLHPAHTVHAQLLAGRYWEDCVSDGGNIGAYSTYHMNAGVQISEHGAAFVRCRAEHTEQAFYNHNNEQPGIAIIDPVGNVASNFANFVSEGIAAGGNVYVIRAQLNVPSESPRVISGGYGTCGATTEPNYYIEDGEFYCSSNPISIYAGVTKFHNCRFYVQPSAAVANGIFLISGITAADVEFINCSFFIDHETHGLTLGKNSSLFFSSGDSTGSTVTFNKCNVFSNASNLDTGAGGVRFMLNSGVGIGTGLTIDYTTFANHFYYVWDAVTASQSATMFAADPIDGDWSLTGGGYSAVNDIGWADGRATLYTAAGEAYALAIAAPTKPVNTVAASLTGYAYPGGTLTADEGTWTGDVFLYRYQWYLDGVLIADENASTYVPVAGDIGSDVTCRVLAMGPGGVTGAVTAAETVAQFAPSDFANLELWLDPSDATSVNAGSPTSTDPIDQLNDLSGNAKHAVGVTTARPLWIAAGQNGLGVIRFDGVNDILTAGAIGDWNFMHVGGGGSVYAAFKSSNVADPNSIFFIASTCVDSNNKGFFFSWDDLASQPANERLLAVVNYGTFANYAVYTASADGAVPANSWHAVGLTIDTAGTPAVNRSAMYADNGTPIKNNIRGEPFTAGDSNRAMEIGSASDSSFWVATDMGELLVFSTPHTPAEAAVVIQYLKDKWGV